MMKGVNHEQQKAVFFRPRCKLWSCPACADINKGLWAVRAFHGAERLQESAKTINFLTLTSHEKLTPQGTLKIWPKAWARLRERARYETGGFDYLLVPERHKNQRLHVHAIETAGLGKRWWKDNARAVGLGFMADETVANTAGGAAYYTVKYLTKSLETQQWPKGFRRVRTSRTWPKLEQNQTPEGWTFAPLARRESLLDVVTHYENMGYDVIILDHLEAWEAIQESEE